MLAIKLVKCTSCNYPFLKSSYILHKIHYLFRLCKVKDFFDFLVSIKLILSIFLFRVQDYEFVDGFKIPELKSVKVEGGGSGPPPGRPGPPDLAQMNKERDAKMARFR